MPQRKVYDPIDENDLIEMILSGDEDEELYWNNVTSIDPKSTFRSALLVLLLKQEGFWLKTVADGNFDEEVFPIKELNMVVERFNNHMEG